MLSNHHRAIWRALALSAVTAGMQGCAGQFNYTPPSAPAAVNNVKVIERDREAVWAASIPELGKRFFVINTIDKASGLINVSYSGDPETYIDCGKITSYVSNLQGERAYEFPAARADQTYEAMGQGKLFAVQRKMALDGRINLIFEEPAPGRTQVTASTKYIVTKSVVVQQIGSAGTSQGTMTINFNSGTSAAFPQQADGKRTECYATGKLEEEVLEAVK